MDHVTCPRCGEDVVPHEPERGTWKLVVAFWAFTLLFGIAAYAYSWGFLLLAAWLLLAMLGMEFGTRTTSWTCPKCNAPLPSPREMGRGRTPSMV